MDARWRSVHRGSIGTIKPRAKSLVHLISRFSDWISHHPEPSFFVLHLRLRRCWGGTYAPPRASRSHSRTRRAAPPPTRFARGHVELGALARLAARADGDSGSELVDGVPAEAHRRFHDDLPWYALPVAPCAAIRARRVRRHHVRAAPDEVPGDRDRDEPHGRGAGAAVSCLTALTWFSVFVLVGSRNHRLVPRGALREDPANLLGRRGRVPGRRLRGPRRRRRRPQLRPDSLRGRDPGRRPLRRRRNRERGLRTPPSPSPLSSRTSAPGSARSGQVLRVARYYPERDLEAFHGPAPVPKSDPKSVDYASKLR